MTRALLFSPLSLLTLVAWIGVAHSFQTTSFVSVGIERNKKLVHNLQLHTSCEETDNNDINNRRTFLISSVITSSSLLYQQQANALPFFQQDRRQLELCLVQVLRTKYWAMNVAKAMNNKLLSPPTNSTAVIELSEAQRKQPYLEARLGAKAILTKKIGGGANSNVVKLASFQLKECLDDGSYWCTELAKSNQLPGQSTGQLKNGKRFCSNELESISDEIVESLASLVEFDGLDNIMDPSPRSSLMISMYDSKKGTFVLLEVSIVPMYHC